MNKQTQSPTLKYSIPGNTKDNLWHKNITVGLSLGGLWDPTQVIFILMINYYHVIYKEANVYILQKAG
jgi:hypothetical protein